jgi:TRAP-type C4-dicarboxylate transport system permease small subunit
MTLGVFVNAGVVLVGLVVAVALGRRFGVDFAAVDRPEATNEAVGPVALLALGALAAFPVAGYLIARASGSRSVLEPALSSALAMVALLVFFGLLAPTALVFVMAVTPIAFGLSCAGAWFGTAR